MSKKRRNLVNDKKYHYTYRITNIKDRMYYYGVRSSNCLPKEDIGVKYFSTSKKNEFIKDQKENPQDYKYKVLKIFSTRKEAVEHEIFLHKKFNVKLHERFYNNANQTSTGFDTAGKEKSQEFKKNLSILASSRKGELNAFYGKHHKEDTKEYIRSCSIGIAVYISEEGEKIRLSVDEANKRGLVAESKGRKYSNEVNMKKGRPGVLNANYGKPLPEATKQKIKDNWHESRTKTQCEHCNKMVLKSHNRFHFDNCKLKGTTDEN